jgi:hypothetical protein
MIAGAARQRPARWAALVSDLAWVDVMGFYVEQHASR